MVQRNPQDKEKPEPKIMVQGKTLKCVKKCKYLGGQLSNDATMCGEIPWRIQQTFASFSKLSQCIIKQKSRP